MNQLCSIRHNIPVTLSTPGAYGQRSVFDNNGDRQSAVLGTRYGTWWPLYGQFEVGWLQLLQLWLSAGISLEAPGLVSRDRYICHVQLHSTWFEPTAECRSWLVDSNLYNGPSPVGLCRGQMSLSLVASWSTFHDVAWLIPVYQNWLSHSQLIPQQVWITRRITSIHGRITTRGTNYFLFSLGSSWNLQSSRTHGHWKNPR